LVSDTYDLLAFPELGTYLVTYEWTEPAFAAAARVLFGEIQARGHLPVSLPGLYPLSPIKRPCEEVSGAPEK